MSAHSFWQYLRIKLIVTLLRLLNHLGTRPHFKPSPTCNRKTIRIPSRDLNRFIDAWLYYPPNHDFNEKYGIVINWHGGGCMLPNLGMDHDFCERIATGSDVVVLDAVYRKAPEHPFPAAVEDAEDTLRWVESRGHQFDLDRVALSGFSSGGNLALVASSELRHEFKINIRAMYADPKSFPEKVVLFVCSGDVLSPEAEAFGKMLQSAGRDAEVVRIEGAHGFDKASSRQLFQPGARDIAYGKVVASLKNVL